MKKILTPGTELKNGNGIIRIDKHLGGGGFGITYRAKWIQGVKTKYTFRRIGEETVVIKEFFNDEFCRRSDNSNEILITDDQKRIQFERLRNKLVSEADLLNSFEHPHIVKVDDVFEENNTAYIVMEYVEGEDLEKRIERKKRCSPDEAIRYISQIASALIEVHNKNALHLDISPSNILINDKDEAQLIDFGVSLVYDPDTGEVKESSRLITGKKSGFSPPEQTPDMLHHFSPPIDLYALGATLYNALTGHKPPESVFLSTGADVLMMPSSYNPKISKYLDFFVLKAMNIKINERFQTAEEFQDALLNGEQKYTSAILQGNDYYASGNYLDAITHFKAAYQLINTNDELNKKIERCELKISEEKEEEAFQNLLTQITVQFDKKEYEQALSGYKKLLTYRPGDTHIAEQIRICQEQINEKSFNQAINDGNAQFEKNNYEGAITLYKVALQYKENDAHCLEQIRICEKMLKYDQAINEGDAHLNKKKYEDAIKSYKQALQYKENDIYCSEQIRICEERINELLYAKEIKEGNAHFKKKRYDKALLSYKNALHYKENDIDASSKITECKEKLAETKLLTSRGSIPITSSKKRLRLILFSILGIVVVGVVILFVIAIRNYGLEQEEHLMILKIEANDAFADKEWNKAYNLYMEIKKLDPDDETGYDKFLHIGTLLMESVGACDGNVKDLLKKAQNLKNTSKVNELLKKCK